jgi:hypothetical protein
VDALGLTQLAALLTLRDRAALALDFEERALVMPAGRRSMALNARLAGGGERSTAVQTGEARGNPLTANLPGVLDPIDHDLVKVVTDNDIAGIRRAHHAGQLEESDGAGQLRGEGGGERGSSRKTRTVAAAAQQRGLHQTFDQTNSD